MIYPLLSRLFPTTTAPLPTPQRIALIQPCCIGDVVLATATLCAFRRAYPTAHITWVVGSWSSAAVRGHPAVDALLDTGAAANPAASVSGLLRTARLLRSGQFDLAISLVRSPWMSLACWLAGIPQRIGLDSAGRGFGYNRRAPIDPAIPRHEADIYLDTARVAGIDPSGCHANLPLNPADQVAVGQRLASDQIGQRYLVIHPGGGVNPGMTLVSKRYPLERLRELTARLMSHYQADAVIIGSASDHALVEALRADLPGRSTGWINPAFGEIGALASGAMLYLGNDTGLTHLAAASGALTVMIFGPSDPQRYAPYGQRSAAIWKPAAVSVTGVAGGIPADWDWESDGISVDQAYREIVRIVSDTI